MASTKFKTIISLMLALVLCLSSVSALACTAIYVGSDLTADGSTMFARSEDISNSYNKVFYVSPAGNHTAGELYKGCYGFTYTFTQDSYSYTAFSDDNGAAVENVCPDCGESHKHTPYEAGGTNEMGVTVSATETLGGSEAVRSVDPMEDLGIEEAEIVTVLLSEADTAKEAVEILLGIYDTAGCNAGSGIFIADNTETWYIENVTGHQYVALKLSSSVAFAVPNQSVIGLIDLDDENVIASEKLIAVAQEAGTYVGDLEANTIDYRASYNADQVANSRMVSALKHFNAAVAKEEPTADDYTISNVDAEGNIVPVYSNIVPDRVFSIEDMVNYYDISGIGSTGNLEIHIFQVFAEDGLTDTVEWVAMDNGCYTNFVPYYPMLTTDTYAGYKVSTAPAVFTQEEPTDADFYYATTGRIRTEEGRVTVDGFKALPENWADSVYWSYDALSNLVLSGKLSEEDLETVDVTLEILQQQCYDTYAELQSAVAAAESEEAAAQAATEISNTMAEIVHVVVAEMVKDLK